MRAIMGYRLKQFIGVGSFAEVWQAERVDAAGRRCADDVALKIGREHYDADRSQRELQILHYTAPLELDGFVRILNLTSYHERLVVSLELAQDSLLGMSRKGLSITDCIRYLGEVATALDSLHARDLHGQRLIHGGINPTDILICSGQAKVADLGPYPLGAPRSIPVYKLVCMAPEFSSQPAPQLMPQSDQYALAATYVWLRLPHGPFAIPRPGELISAIELGPLPEPERQVLLTAMNPDPQKRYPSCSAFVTALQISKDPENS